MELWIECDVTVGERAFILSDACRHVCVQHAIHILSSDLPCSFSNWIIQAQDEVAPFLSDVCPCIVFLVQVPVACQCGISENLDAVTSDDQFFRHFVWSTWSLNGVLINCDVPLFQKFLMLLPHIREHLHKAELFSTSFYLFIPRPSSCNGLLALISQKRLMGLWNMAEQTVLLLLLFPGQTG